MFFNFLSDEQNETIGKSMESFRGQASTLESALGAVVIGHQFGWRVLKIIHSPATYRKYEKAIGLKFQNICPEYGPNAKKSIGLKLAEKLGSFWAVATGKKKIKDKGMLGNEKDIREAEKNAD